MRTPLSPSTSGQWALVTGGSSGIGQAFAYQLAQKGFDIVIVGRSSTRLELTKRAIEAAAGVTVDTVQLDLSHDDSGDSLLEAVAGRNIGVYVAVAGEGTPGLFWRSEVDEYLDCVNLKVRTNLVVTHALARDMRARGRGHILLVTSTGALQGVPKLASNAAAEAYLLALGEALHHELKPYGVNASVLLPGPTRTPGLSAMVPDPKDYPPGTSSPESTAAQGIRLLERGKVFHIAGALNRTMLSTLSRRARTRVMGKMVGSLFVAEADKVSSAAGDAR